MNVSTVSTSSVSRGGKLLRIFLSLVLIIGLMPSLGAMSVEKAYAAAVDTVTIVMKDSTGETKTLATWTYDETNATYNEEDGTEVSIVEDFSGETEGGYVYTGINRKPDPRCIAVCSKGITVENLYKYAGALLNEKTGEGILKSDDVKLSFGSTVGTHSGIQDTYNGYWGKTRYYYPKWYTAETYSATVTEELQAGAVEAPTTLAITSFHSALANDGKKEVSELLKSADQENALRVLISQEEGGNATDINLGTNSTKNVSYIEFVSPNKTFADLGLVDPEPEPEPTGYEWYGDGLATEYIISTAAELAAFANIVNGTVPEEISIAQDNFAGKTVTLANDIVLAEDNLYTVNENVSFGAGSYAMTADQYVVNADAPRWTPIGSGIATSNINATGNTFAGTFDGNGKTISGLYIGTGTAATANTNTVAGLFGIVSGTVKNVTVSGCITAKIVAGGVVAHLAGGTVSNCVNNVNLFADGGTTPNGNVENGVSRCGAVGGIVGIAADGSTITGCTNAGAIVCPNTNKGGRAGGILGLIDSGTIVVTGCSNSGLVSAYSYAGGIVGGNWSATSSIDSCSNTGHVVANTGGSGYAGGITAYAAGPISDCYNSGEISIIRLSGNKAGHFGGIVSDLVGASATVTNCYNTGALTFGGACTSWSSAGAIAGSGWTGKLTNCHYVANVTSAYGLTAADLTTSTSDVQTGDVVALVKGDVNNSGALNIVDAQLAYSYGAKKLSADTLAELMARWSNNEALAQTMFKAAADVNDDGAVDAGDAFAIQYALHHGGFETAGE